VRIVLPAVIIWEWENAKDERLKKYYDTDLAAERIAYWEKKIKEGIVKSINGYSDNFGHLVYIAEFENMENLAKIVDDDEYKELNIKVSRVVDNCCVRILTSTIGVPPE
jgi:hypothetical protein